MFYKSKRKSTFVQADTQFLPPILSSKNCVNERNVFDRLTDPHFYTGSHKWRFDEYGNGRGLAGREYVYVNDGSTESANRCHEVFSSVVKPPRLPVVEPGTLGIQRYGVQVITPKLIWLYRNGDKYHRGVALFVRKYMTTLEHVLQAASKLVQPLGGPARRLYDQNLHRISHLEELVDGAKYLCTSGEPPSPLDRLEKFLSSWVVHPV